MTQKERLTKVIQERLLELLVQARAERQPLRDEIAKAEAELAKWRASRWP